MAANVAPVSYANVAKKAADPDEEAIVEIVENQENSTESSNKTGEKKKKSKKSKAERKAKKAAKLAAAAKEAEKAESSDLEVEKPVYIDAPPPKVNPWLAKKSTTDQSSQEETENEKEFSAIMKESTAENRPPPEKPKKVEPNNPVQASQQQPQTQTNATKPTSGGFPWKTAQVRNHLQIVSRVTLIPIWVCFNINFTLIFVDIFKLDLNFIKKF